MGFPASFAPNRSGTGHARRGGNRSRTQTRSYVLDIGRTSFVILTHRVRLHVAMRTASAAQRAVQAFAAEELTLEEALRTSRLATTTAASLWNDACWDVLTRRHLEVVRRTGVLSVLPLALHNRALVHLFGGELALAASLVDEARTVTEMTGSTWLPYGEIGLAAMRGSAEQAEPLLDSCLLDAAARSEGVGVNVAQWARAVLYNGLGRYGDAVAAARQAAAHPCELGPRHWALAELVEAAARGGHERMASAALEQLSAMTRASGTDWALGVEASRRALLRDDAAADALHREAIERLGRTTVRLELARAQLLYGEWLRREGRRADARAQLRTAREALTAMGVAAFAVRARRELLATGETVRKRTVETSRELTPQEAQIARLVADGLTNPEIGADALPQPANGRMAPPEDLREARHQQPPTVAPLAAHGSEEREPGVSLVTEPHRRRGGVSLRRRLPLGRSAGAKWCHPQITGVFADFRQVAMPLWPSTPRGDDDPRRGEEAAGPPNAFRGIERCAQMPHAELLTSIPYTIRTTSRSRSSERDRPGGVEGGPKTNPQATGSTAAAQ